MTPSSLFLRQVRENLDSNILGWWLGLQDPQGGFYGEVDGQGAVQRDAPRGTVLNARIIWAFSAAYRMLGTPAYLAAARHAAGWFTGACLDPQYGGAYWSVSAQGGPLEDKKQLYAQGFAIYGLSELFLADGDQAALEAAIGLFHTTERYFHDGKYGGYTEALARDFSPLPDCSLSAHDIDADKTMNSHLHLLEAYANLYKAWPDPLLGERTRELIDLVRNRIMGPDGHLRLYFRADWSVLPGAVSYGHDIETSWLLQECALALGDDTLMEGVRESARRMADAGNEGLFPDGSMAYEALPDGTRDDSRQWWVQAETVVGNLWAWKHLGRKEGLERALAAWEYIRTHLIRPEGEWYWGIGADGKTDTSSPLAGFWKCPYHNARMCLEALRILA